MTDTKRNLEEFLDPSLAHDDKKAHTKPGRKPLDTEPKSKRTAQNRAAQRAYRERKERKMKDLEDQVASLEDANIKAATEADLLRAQIDLLKSELARHRGHSDFSDLKLPTSVKKLSNPATSSLKPHQVADFPWANTNSATKDNKENGQPLPDLVSGSSSSTSPNDNTLVSPESNASDSTSNPLTNLSPQNQFNISPNYDEQLDPFCVKLSEACGNKNVPVPKYRRTSGSVPPYQERKKLTSPNSSSNIQENTPAFPNSHTLFSPTDSNSDPFFNDPSNYNFPLNDGNAGNDPLSFLNDNNFDLSMAFGNPTNDFNVKKEEFDPTNDPVAGITSEQSAYDPFEPVNTDFNFNEFVKSSLPSEMSSKSNSVSDAPRSTLSMTSHNTMSPALKEANNENDSSDDNEVVPAPEQTIRCSEIWDRVTLHPRYTDIDIDGLCNELKSKAKCSENGVVLDARDVNRLIEQSALRR